MNTLFISFLQINQMSKSENENIAIVGIVLQIAIALSILKVWLLNYNTIVQDFKDFQLPDWLRKVVGAVKMSLSIALIGGIWINWLAIYTSIVIGVLMAGAILSHYFAGHSFKKSIEAVIVFILCVAVIYINTKYQYQNYILGK